MTNPDGSFKSSLAKARHSWWSTVEAIACGPSSELCTNEVREALHVALPNPTRAFFFSPGTKSATKGSNHPLTWILAVLRAVGQASLLGKQEKGDWPTEQLPTERRIGNRSIPIFECCFGIAQAACGRIPSGLMMWWLGEQLCSNRGGACQGSGQQEKTNIAIGLVGLVGLLVCWLVGLVWLVWLVWFPPPKLPAGRDTLPRFLPPPPRPSTSSEVRKLPSPQQAQPKPAQAFRAQEKLRPNKAEDDEKDSWSWWKGHWWDWDSQEKNDVEVEQGQIFGYLCWLVDLRLVELEADGLKNLAACGLVVSRGQQPREVQEKETAIACHCWHLLALINLELFHVDFFWGRWKQNLLASVCSSLRHVAWMFHQSQTSASFRGQLGRKVHVVLVCGDRQDVFRVTTCYACPARSWCRGAFVQRSLNRMSKFYQF